MLKTNGFVTCMGEFTVVPVIAESCCARNGGEIASSSSSILFILMGVCGALPTIDGENSLSMAAWELKFCIVKILWSCLFPLYNLYHIKRLIFI